MADDATNPDASSIPHTGAALQHRPWRSFRPLSSGLDGFERFLGEAGFDRAPWAAVGFAGGIAAWFVLAGPWQWLALICLCAAVTCLILGLVPASARHPFLRQSLAVLSATIAAGCLVVWGKSTLAGTPAIRAPFAGTIAGTVMSREEQPAEGRIRLVLATRESGTGRAIRVRVNVPQASISPDIIEGAVVRLGARLMPPSAPVVPGSYDFARAAWFSGLAATGTAYGKVELVARPAGPDAQGWQAGLAQAQRTLSAHVRAALGGSPGAIAAAFASGDRGGIAQADEAAMRDAGLTHLLSISGLHVSAVIAAAYVFALRLMALWPWLALRVRLPVLAAAAGASAGVGYTLLTGAEVPTVRSCIGAILVLLALALGREPLSLRMVAVAAVAVLLLWPEAAVSPGFQMSFGVVVAIVALHSAKPVREVFARREEPWWAAALRHLALVLLTGLAIELALMPIGLFHFHRTGIFGAFANVIAIPLTTFATMPLIALALVCDLVGIGAPAWWLVGKSLELLLALAHAVANVPGAVAEVPTTNAPAFGLFLVGALWLALWRGPVRLAGAPVALFATLAMLWASPPDMLVSGDGSNLAIAGLGPERTGLALLRGGSEGFVRDTLVEMAGGGGAAIPFAQWPGARCSPEYCVVRIVRGGRAWTLLVARGSELTPWRDLVTACERSDIVVAPRRLPQACRPRWLKADRIFLRRNGGLAIDLDSGRARTVAQGQGRHGWWQPAEAVVPPTVTSTPAGAAISAKAGS